MTTHGKIADKWGDLYIFLIDKGFPLAHSLTVEILNAMSTKAEQYLICTPSGNTDGNTLKHEYPRRNHDVRST